ncbi:leucine-rich repeat-containing protein 45 [Sinocyclocheilus grahami]|uniref:leucine-rich repeat-containing protein 45 n=1 Tax=Sinocyclocheilus grahami TaxID=75366 RepID=UPI0007AD2A7C|nr:PREDICTED: leucine-rich repeat-containing protein 45 [Sinocyclocheilus grahami]
MEDFRRSYLRLCKEGGTDAQESVLAQLHDSRTGTGSCRLDLRGQSVTVDTCSVLGRVLQSDAVFTEILLSDCMLSEEGVKLILNGLCSNTTVKVLDLKGNNMRGTGSEALGQLLVRNKILRRETENKCFILCADLRWNNIGLLGGRSVLEAMQQNRALIKLEMAGNNIPSDTLRAIEQSMNHNADRQSTLRESRSRTQVLSKEIQLLKDEKSRQFLSMMETIDRQKDEMGRSSRNSSIRLGQLQGVLSEQKSSVNSLTAKLQMTEAALALSEQKAHDLGELLTRVKMEKAELRDRQSREIKKEQEASALKEAKLLKEVNSLSEKNLQLRNKLEETERRCKTQQEQIFELKQELTNTTAELKLRLAQTEERLEMEKRRSKQALEDMDSLRQKEVDHLTRHQEESERALQERILKLEGQRIQLEEVLSCCSKPDLAGKEQVKVAEVTRVRVELQEQIGHLQAERTAQGGLKEKIAALEREMKVLSATHREALLDKESEISSLLERLRIREGEIQRIREDEAQRASFLQNAILTYVQGSPLAHFSPKK